MVRRTTAAAGLLAAVAAAAAAATAAGATLPLPPPGGAGTPLLFPHPGATACTHRLRTYYCGASCACAPAGGCACAASAGARTSAAAVRAAAAGAAGASFTAFDGTPFRPLGGVPALASDGGTVALLSDAAVRVNADYVTGDAGAGAGGADAAAAPRPLLLRTVALLGGPDAVSVTACGVGRLCIEAGTVDVAATAAAAASAAPPAPVLTAVRLAAGDAHTLPGGVRLAAARWPRGDVAYVTLGGVYEVRVMAVTAPWAPRHLDVAVRLVGVPSAPHGLLGQTVGRVWAPAPAAAPADGASAAPAAPAAVVEVEGGGEAYLVDGLWAGAAGGRDRYGASAAPAEVADGDAAAAGTARRQLLGIVGSAGGGGWAEATAVTV